MSVFKRPCPRHLRIHVIPTVGILCLSTQPGCRLARNRAAARLRRQRKKNLVETYEAEVTALEANLKKLQSHEWGGDKEAEAGSVEEALGESSMTS